MELIEGVGESSSPPRSFSSNNNYDLKTDVYNRLVETGNEDVVGNPEFRDQLSAHFNRLPASYLLDVNMDRVEVLVEHMKLLELAKDPVNRPSFHVRFLETKVDGDEDQLHGSPSSSKPSLDADSCHVGSNSRDSEHDLEPCLKMEDLKLDIRQSSWEMQRRQVVSCHIHEVIFSTVDKPKLLSQLSALLSDIGLNIREAHVFSTTDGYSLDVFVVDGWEVEDTDSLHEALAKTIVDSEGSWNGSSHSQALAAEMKPRSWEIDTRLLKMGEKIASGSCGDLYHGVYLGQDVAIKILRNEHLTEASEGEFAQEVSILREVQHKNVVRFIGACTKSPKSCIVTEFMHGGSLFNYLHKSKRTLKLSQVLKFAVDVCKGMEYLHQNNIIHRDLKTANLLMDTNQVVKVADFGVARFLNQEGVMTAETGTYRWMAPEVINHMPYDQKADIFSFAIVLWELITAKVPYDNMTPLQAALGVRQGLRPELPEDMHPKLLDIMQRCWDNNPGTRPPFSALEVELEELLQEIKGS
ncbi:hypothetical protein V2J09_023736 [Rumex salicifolius]